MNEIEHRDQIVKTAYAKLYDLGCNKEEVRQKLDFISKFFGNIGCVSNMSNEEIGLVIGLLETMKTLHYKFENGSFKIC